MMTYSSVRTAGRKTFAEVFSSPGVVTFMTLSDGIRDVVRKLDATIFDPAVGEGQFPCFALVCKLFYQIDRLDEDIALRALKSLFGMDIQPKSVETCRTHILQTLVAAYEFFTGNEFTKLDDANVIVNENFTVGDSIKYMRQCASRQISLF